MAWEWFSQRPRTYNKWEGLPAESILLQWLGKNYDIYRESGLRNKEQQMGKRTRREIVLREIHRYFIEHGVDYMSLEQIRNKIKTSEKSWKDGNAILEKAGLGLDRTTAYHKMKSQILTRCPQWERLDPIFYRPKAGAPYDPSQAGPDVDACCSANMSVTEFNKHDIPDCPAKRGKYRWKNSVAEAVLLDWMERSDTFAFGMQRGMSSTLLLNDIQQYFKERGVKENFSNKQIYAQLIYMKRRWKDACAALDSAGPGPKCRGKVLTKYPMWSRLDKIFGHHGDESDSSKDWRCIDLEGLPPSATPDPDDAADFYINQAASLYRINSPHDSTHHIDQEYQDRNDYYDTSRASPENVQPMVTLISVCNNIANAQNNDVLRDLASSSERQILPKGIRIPEGCLWCKACEAVTTGPCVVHSPSMTDQIFLPRALATLPKDLFIAQTSDMNDKGVFARIQINEPTIFGPLVGETFSYPKRGCRFASRLSDGTIRYYRLLSDDSCNWMKYVREADVPAEGNLVAFQQKDRIYFVSTRPLEAGDEFRIKRAPDCTGGCSVLSASQAASPSIVCHSSSWIQNVSNTVGQSVYTPMQRDIDDDMDTDDTCATSSLPRFTDGLFAVPSPCRRQSHHVSCTAAERTNSLQHIRASTDHSLPTAQQSEGLSSASQQENNCAAASLSPEYQGVISSVRSRKSIPHKVSLLDESVIPDLQAERDTETGEIFFGHQGNGRLLRTTSVIVQGKKSPGPRKPEDSNESTDCSQSSLRSVRSYVRKTFSTSRISGKAMSDALGDEFMEEKLDAVLEINPYQHVGYHASTAAWRTVFHNLQSRSVLSFNTKGVWHLKMCIRRHVDRYFETAKEEATGVTLSRYDCLLKQVAELHKAAQAKKEELYPYPCQECHKRFGTARNLQKHVGAVHAEEDRQFECTECSLSFDDRREHRKHITKYHRKSITHPCPVCFKIFNDTYSLHAHSEEHRVDGKFFCRFCPQKEGFPEFYFLTRHIRIFHSGRTFICDTCQKVFKSEKGLQKHAVCHSSSFGYICETCGRKFKRKPHYEDHIKRLHNPDRVYKMKERSEKVAQAFATAEICQFCTRQYANVERLLIHQRAKHLEKMPLELRIPKPYIGKEAMDDLYASGCSDSE